MFEKKKKLSSFTECELKKFNGDINDLKSYKSLN